jgi:MoaA/NifB/PqqE/SkfB family radical SAM enzyme
MVAPNERRYVVQSKADSEAERLAYMVANMSANKAYRYALQHAGNDPGGCLLSKFQDRFKWYRAAWRGNPRHAIEHKLHHEAFSQTGFPPLCLDIEVASVCDLACPFCFRQWIATPDKLMREDLYYRIIDQCVELGVPSVKLNWRGESLLHPKLPHFVDYAKRAGILETIINTNAVTLDETKSRALIEAGLDLMIYSFDGGTRETYEKMRVGRFQDNHFETVYENIRRFSRIRKEMGAVFPRTKIQMILTEQTYNEQDLFFTLFSDCVDDVSVKAYTERGGKLPDLDMKTRRGLSGFLQQNGLSESAAYWRDINGTMYIASGRLPCEQVYQRLIVTYDGRVGMCCYDWGNEYPIGYIDTEAFLEGDKQYNNVMEKARSGAEGFKLLTNIKMPERYIKPPEQVQNLREIWYGDLLNNVRQKHIEGCLEEVPICRRCPFKETYRWVKVQLPSESTIR